RSNRLSYTAPQTRRETIPYDSGGGAISFAAVLAPSAPPWADGAAAGAAGAATGALAVGAAAAAGPDLKTAFSSASRRRVSARSASGDPGGGADAVAGDPGVGSDRATFVYPATRSTISSSFGMMSPIVPLEMKMRLAAAASASFFTSSGRQCTSRLAPSPNCVNAPKIR